MRWIYVFLALAAGIAATILLDRIGTRRGQDESQASQAAASPTLADLAAGRLRVVDLCWPLNAQSAYWPGDNYKPFELRTIATLERDGVLSKAFCSPEHLGTHLDAPNHFEAQGDSVDRIGPKQLFSPGVVIDVRVQVSADPDYRVSVDDVRRFENDHGQIPPGAVVMALTGWGQFWGNATRYQNKDVMNRLHFPGYSAEAAQFLIDHRAIHGLGLDTMSVDYGLSRDFVVHHLLGRAGRYGLENLAHLDSLPPRGFMVFVAPMKIEGGSGGPARVFAVLAKDVAD